MHALQNFFHVDSESLPKQDQLDRAVYNLNAILPGDIVIKRLFQVKADLHSRFDAIARTYKYFIYTQKDPFVDHRAYYYPYQLDMDKLNEAAAIIQATNDFIAFSKKNSQVKHYQCTILSSGWNWEDNLLVYTIKGNRFLRGMVKGLVGTMLKYGTGKLTLEGFRNVIHSNQVAQADFSVPSHGLFLIEVDFPAVQAK